jgi:hypothetical protein
MISYTLYKVIHITGVALLFTALGAVALASAQGLLADRNRARRIIGIAHGTALVIVIVSGMGLAARLGLMGHAWPLWLWAKIGLWAIMGAATALIRRVPERFAWVLFLLPLLATCAAYLALFKPGSGPL